MDLMYAGIQGFRRFEERENVRLRENLISLIGPNEAGKSSILDALSELNKATEIGEYDVTRGSDESTVITATFRLGESDLENLSHIEGAENLNECTFVKSESGNINTALSPGISHNLEPREDVKEEIGDLNPDQWEKDNLGDKNKRRGVKKEVNKHVSLLDTSAEYLGEASISNLENFAAQLLGYSETIEIENHQSTIQSLGESIEELVEHERDCPPERARKELERLRPRFILFEEEDRDLKKSYNLSEHNNFPQALENLSDLAGIDLQELKEASENENRAQVKGIKREANSNLEHEFSRSWVRSEVVPVIDMDGTVLHLLTKNQDERSYSRIDERSDGLRWFVALLSFLNSRHDVSSPILLVDEAERHLSYDAQANLIEVLESQEIAQKVIYTTHSAGCLPSDLGTGIRPIIPKNEKERSDIKNGFWHSGEGFSPLMMAMGLSPLAFTVSRNTLVAEGPSECVLLPSLIREATGREDLKYQIAPGASSVSSESVHDLQAESGKTAFILDGDGGGENIERKLTNEGVDSEKIVNYGTFSDDVLVLEDLIKEEAYVEAFNEEIREWQHTEEELTVSELPEKNRASAMEQWCANRDLDEISKTSFCQRLAEKSTNQDIVAPGVEDTLEGIDGWAIDYFDIDSPW